MPYRTKGIEEPREWLLALKKLTTPCLVFPNEYQQTLLQLTEPVELEIVTAYQAYAFVRASVQALGALFPAQ